MIAKQPLGKSDKADILGRFRTKRCVQSIAGRVIDLKFSEYAQGLSPYISGGQTESTYFVELVGNFIKDDAMDSYQILKRKEDTRYRYIVGSRDIPPKHAKYLYTHRDKVKFSGWVEDQMDNYDSFDGVREWLDKNEIPHEAYNVSDACADLLESIFLELSGTGSQGTAKQESFVNDFALIDEIEEKIKALPRPTNIAVPEEATSDERKYISELYGAYGDAEKIEHFSDLDLSRFPEYKEDLSDRRIDFYAAESIKRGVLELGNGVLTTQFDVLKSETYDGVKDTARRNTYPNAYERMLAVMEQSVNLVLQDYLLSKSPYWISGKIKKGVCHHLVNDGRLHWVRKQNAK